MRPFAAGARCASCRSPTRTWGRSCRWRGSGRFASAPSPSDPDLVPSRATSSPWSRRARPTTWPPPWRRSARCRAASLPATATTISRRPTTSRGPSPRWAPPSSSTTPSSARLRRGPSRTSGWTYTSPAAPSAWRRVCAQHPRVPGALRLVLLHDPGAFRHLAEGEGDLVLSGHTHGGQLGLVSLGAPYTVLRLFMDMPDHGLWARGRDRLYVHRGTGHYGFPVRLGVPAEESLLRVHLGA